MRAGLVLVGEALLAGIAWTLLVAVVLAAVGSILASVALVGLVIVSTVPW